MRINHPTIYKNYEAITLSIQLDQWYSRLHRERD